MTRSFFVEIQKPSFVAVARSRRGSLSV